MNILEKSAITHYDKGIDILRRGSEGLSEVLI